MKIFWHHNGQQGADGNYVVEVQEDSGKTVSTFKGPDLQSITADALNASAQASAHIAQLRRERRPDQAPASPTIGAPRQLTADERFQLSQDITDPEKAPEAVAALITAATGATPQAIHQTLDEVQQERTKQRYKVETDTFLANNPDYYPHDTNRDRIAQAMKLANHDWTSNNLQIVYDELQSQGLLIERPDEAEDLHEQTPQPGQRQAANPASEPNPPRQTRPRQTTVSTGMRSSQTSATAPPPAPPVRMTRAQLEAMPREQYHEKMRDPKFVEMVDQMPRR